MQQSLSLFNDLINFVLVNLSLISLILSFFLGLNLNVIRKKVIIVVRIIIIIIIRNNVIIIAIIII